MPSAFRASAMRRSVRPCALKARRRSAMGASRSTASALFWSARMRPFAPSTRPRALAAASAALVRCEIMSRSCSATAARMCRVRRVAWGLSTAMKSALASIIWEMKATFRASRSSLAMMSVALCFRAKASAACSWGRRSRAFAPLPVSISVNSASGGHPPLLKYRMTASRWASRPKPE